MALPRGWKIAVLKGIGAPVTENNLALLRAWQLAEGGGTMNAANFNPLNTTQDAQGASSINSVGVKSYRNARQGIQATIKTLLNGYYEPIVGNLRRSASPARTAQAIAASPWGTGEGVLRVLGTAPNAAAQTTAPPPRQNIRDTFSVQSPPTLTVIPPKLPDMLPSAQDALEKVASGQGWTPTETLERSSQGLLSSLLKPSTLKITRPQAPDLSATSPSPVTSGSGLQGPGGSWGGSYKPATQIAKVAEQYGLTPSSEKREKKMTASGGVSDHWVGSTSAYAYDLSGTVAEMDKAAKAISAKLGVPYKGGPLVATVNRNGLRYQVLYRTMVGGNHFTHIHVGVKALG